MKILPIPEVPLDILNAANNKNLAIFLGAGVSRLVKCLGWDELSKNLIKVCFDTTKKDSNKKIISYKEEQTLLAIGDHRKIITICQKLLKKEGKEELFFYEMEKALKFRERISEPNIYTDLAKISALFITTNADEHFDLKFGAQIKYFENDISALDLNIDNLYHIHGSIKDKKSLVFTLKRYFERYNDRYFKEFLKEIFNKYIILFVGYGLSEFELLEYLFENGSHSKNEIRHYMLNPYFIGEENILEMDQYYYEDMNIRVIAYQKDYLGYEQLNLVISKWVEDILALTMQVPDRLDLIDQAVK